MLMRQIGNTKHNCCKKCFLFTLDRAAQHIDHFSKFGVHQSFINTYCDNSATCKC